MDDDNDLENDAVMLRVKDRKGCEFDGEGVYDRSSCGVVGGKRWLWRCLWGKQEVTLKGSVLV